ncbi:MAG: hypothetical protein Q8S05_05125 [Sulfuricella sp.]|nr:hypothetical protein [Sulfuricella sp.]
MAWRIEFDPRALDELKGLDKPVQSRIIKVLRERLPHWPTRAAWAKPCAEKSSAATGNTASAITA